MQSSAPEITCKLHGSPQHSNLSQLAGPLMIFASACGFGLNPLFVQFLAQEGFDTLTTTFYRFAIPGLICAAFLPCPSTVAGSRPDARAGYAQWHRRLLLL